MVYKAWLIPGQDNPSVLANPTNPAINSSPGSVQPWGLCTEEPWVVEPIEPVRKAVGSPFLLAAYGTTVASGWWLAMWLGCGSLAVPITPRGFHAAQNSSFEDLRAGWLLPPRHAGVVALQYMFYL